MKIVCARLRSNVTYTGPLETVLDSFFYLYDLWMKQHPEYTYDSYNLSFDRKKKPRRDADVFKDADVVVIPRHVSGDRPGGARGEMRGEGQRRS